MKVAVALAIAAIGFGGARIARAIATQEAEQAGTSEPYAPSPSSAPYIALGYREAAADVLFVRLRGYFGDDHNTANGVASLCEAIVALDPRFFRIYDYCGRAMTLAREGVNQSTYLRAIAVLERGAKEFPKDWRLPNLAGQIYTQDLATDDPAQRREWDEKGTLLVEKALRKPGAPAELAGWAALMRTKFGQHERAARDLREVLLLTTETKAREALIKRLADLEKQDADELAGELYEARRAFNRDWTRDRPMVPPTMYILLGPRLQPGFDMASLATGGRDLITAETVEKLEPLQ